MRRVSVAVTAEEFRQLGKCMKGKKRNFTRGDVIHNILRIVFFYSPQTQVPKRKKKRGTR